MNPQSSTFSNQSKFQILNKAVSNNSSNESWKDQIKNETTNETKIIEVDYSKRADNSLKTKYISECPECQTSLSRIKGEAQHYCPNINGCLPQIIGRIQHYISRKALDGPYGE